MKKEINRLNIKEKNLKVKRNINLLDKPLFLPQRAKTQLTELYSDNYLIRASKGLPVSYDIDILNLLLMKAQYGKSREIKFYSMNDIITQVGYNSSSSSSYDIIENSLDKWESVRIKFYGKSFYCGDGLKKSTDSIPVFGRNIINQKEIIIRFDQDFYDMNCSSYSRDISFKLLKELTPYSKRMFEILSKNFNNREEWFIGKEKLIEKIPILLKEPEKRISNITAKIFREFKYKLKDLGYSRNFVYNLNKKTGIFWFKIV